MITDRPKPHLNLTPVNHGILEILNEVDRPGEVCTHGDRPLVMPGLQINELGELSLPLGETQACELINLCQQAPYGKGTETLVDTDVRRVWELDTDQFTLTNPEWSDLITGIVTELQCKLGLQDCNLEAHPYKLLLYEKGSFFLPHRDGEKLDRMVATLVVGLPAKHQGGELIVSHDERRHEIMFAGAASGYKLSFAAFYADCQHEVRPMKSGYRLCIVYNLTLGRSRGKHAINAPSFTATTRSLGKWLGNWRAEPESEMLAITLDHHYTQGGLTLNTLKGIDRARARVLFEAAEQAGCMAHLALITLWEFGSADEEYEDFSYARGYDWPDDDEEDEEESTSNYEMTEIHESSLSASHWSDHEGNEVHFGTIRIDMDDIVSAVCLGDSNPSEEEFEGFTGNEGMTLERWYHRAAIVVWPRERHFQVLCRAGTDAAVGGLRSMVDRLGRSPQTEYDDRYLDCVAFAAKIIDGWQAVTCPSGEAVDKNDRSQFLSLLIKLDDASLVQRFISEVMPQDVETQLSKSFCRFCGKHGWADFEPGLVKILSNLRATTVNRNAELLSVLSQQQDKNADRLALCIRLSNQMTGALKVFDNSTEANDWQAHQIDRAALLVALVDTMLVIKADKPLALLIDHVLGSAAKYHITKTQIAAIYTLEAQISNLSEANSSILKWLAACRRQLEKYTHEAPQKPIDYRRTNKLSCNCKDCYELSLFLANALERQHLFAVRKDRRQHLHQIIRRHHCDLTHVTERKGSPYTLVCTKTTATYNAALKTYKRDLENLKRIVGLEKTISAG
jgi:hypothetical protein